MRLSLLILVLLLAGCDKLTGAADQKMADAEAIGFACRVSGKVPEDCMKENEAQSPSSLLDGWKSADEDIKAGKLNPNLSAAAAKAEADKPVDEKKDGEAIDAKKDAAKKDALPADAPKDKAKH